MSAWIWQKAAETADMVPWHLFSTSHVLSHLFLIAIVLAVGKRYMSTAIAWMTASISMTEFAEVLKEHRDSIERFLRICGTIILHVTVLFLILDLFHVDIVPILVSAGFLGIIVGLVVSSSVRTALDEFLSWLRIVTNNQYRVGEEIKINGFHEGVVTKIDIQLTTMQGKDGEFTVRNSTISVVDNHSRKKQSAEPPKPAATRSDFWRIVRERRRGRRPWKKSRTKG